MKTYTTILLSFLFAGATFAQSFTSYRTGSSFSTNVTPQGGSCLMGGASESDDAMRWFLQRANGGDVLVLRASGSDGYNNYMYSDLGVTVNSVETIVFNNSSASSETYIHQRIEEAEAIWFAGGDQWNYVSYWRNTTIQNLINDAVNNRNVVIGGTSAGMAILGGHYFSAENGTITSAQALANPYANDATVSSTPFLENSFLTDVITDTHYDDPDRRGRHTAFLARIITDNSGSGIIPKGIACDEYTAVCIDDVGLARVFGDYPTYDDNAYFIQPNCELTDMLPETCTANTALHWDKGGMALKVYKIKGTVEGTHTFDLSDWQTGTGGTWEHWSVNNGTFVASVGTQINCILSVDELAQPTVEVYPNPVKSNLIVSAEKPIQAIELLDGFGRIVLQKDVSNVQETSLQLLKLSSGTYFLKVQVNDAIIIKKVIK
ncbi:T9SS type A sorting domain-containing protein [Kordia algicida OT-1]|uniref:Cyanophycinase and related exopeptidase-like protein n=1 Tax=Kordia algicida OT-1 TaxID=391587 RepID=A9E3P1_9FLAO|nr:T9SS type A sorting domain-containing protein [Kordia algicida]EDP95247.1 cyanophycinase and related exopeptidase-like protein [Kordia algicida OT-1]